MVIDFLETQERRRRLTARYGAPTTDPNMPPLTAHELVQAVAAASDPDPVVSSWPVPQTEDLLDALALVATARERLEYAELALLDAGRRAELTWETLGEALGYAPTAARQGASGRARRLLERWPGFRASKGGTVLRQDQAGAPNILRLSEPEDPAGRHGAGQGPVGSSVARLDSPA